VRPTWWTPSCGDAGYQLEGLAYDTWTPTHAAAHGTTRITHGDHAATTHRISVDFSHPQPVAEFQDQLLFSRAVVTYLAGSGPTGTATDYFDLADVWTDAIAARDATPPPCTSPAEPNDCAADLGDPYEEGPTSSPNP